LRHHEHPVRQFGIRAATTIKERNVAEDFDRRSFIRRTSMGAAAAGALAVTGAGILGEASSASAATPKTAAPKTAESHDEALLEGSDVLAQVVNARTGEISILVGTREIKYINRGLAQELMRAAK
jgi:hypothetical protein